MYNGSLSSLGDISCGVPQGSILGPLLFLIYINDIINSSKILHFILFADDTNLFYSHPNFKFLIETVNCELLKLASWFHSNKLSVNIKKTHCIIFGNKRLPLCHPTVELLLDGIIIERVKCTTFLGVYVDEQLNWKQQILNLSQKK